MNEAEMLARELRTSLKRIERETARARSLSARLIELTADTQEGHRARTDNEGTDAEGPDGEMHQSGGTSGGASPPEHGAARAVGRASVAAP